MNTDSKGGVWFAAPALDHVTRHRSWKSRIRTATKATAVLISLVLLSIVLGGHGSNHISGITDPWTAPTPDTQHASANEWADIPPSRTLTWHPCYDDAQYDCARLDLPMNWPDSTSHEHHRVVLGVMRLRANVTSALGPYRGPVFVNPGGPGGSGVWALRDHGRLLQRVVGDNHDVVAFDPRGVGASVPRIECWGSDRMRREWEAREVGVVGDDDDEHHAKAVLGEAYARAEALSQVCFRSSEMNDSGILRHSSTIYAARDMLEIMTQMGEERLKYWGFSYGTVLGGVFATLYPDKVERMVSDGNVDLQEWFYGSRVNHCRDTDKVMDAFYETCHAAGPGRCDFYAPSPGEIEARLDRLVANLTVRPVIVPSSSDSGGGPDLPEIITYSSLKRLIATVLYQPVRMFPSFATALAQLEKRDGAAFYDLFLSGSAPPPPPPPMCDDPGAVPPTIPGPGDEGTPDAFAAVYCADAPPLADGVDGFAAYAARLRRISRAAGAVYADTRLACAGREGVRPGWALPDSGAGSLGGRTAFPILFLANGADNITPLVSARNNSALFPGSAVLVVRDGLGHTSLAAPSRCAAEHVRGYFQEGRVPGPGTSCGVDVVPFGDKVEEEGDGGEGDELGRAVWELSLRADLGFMRLPRMGM